MTHELKPCPFCGVPPKQHNFTGGDCQYICDNSECRVAVYTMPSPSVQMAKDVWNTRAEAQPSTDVVERVARFQEALEDIAASHVPDQPAESAAEPEVFVRMWVGRLRGIATEALKQQPQENAE